MAYTVDFAADYDVFDGRETVTFHARGPAGTAAGSVTVPHALREIADVNDVAAGGLFGKTALVWHLRKQFLGGLAPKITDWLVDAAGVTYTVRDVGNADWADAYRLTCTKGV